MLADQILLIKLTLSGFITNIMSTLCLIPARGGSKGIPNKNIKGFCGKPLIQWTIEKAFASSLADEVLVSTDDKKIARVAESCGASVPFLRPPALATDTSSAISVILHAIDHLPDFTDLLLL